MAGAYLLSPRAEADLEEIWHYTTERWSIEQAESYTNDIFDTFERLSDGLTVGRPVSVRDGYFRALTGRHAVYFVMRSDTVVVIRVLHQSMDVERQLSF